MKPPPFLKHGLLQLFRWVQNKSFLIFDFVDNIEEKDLLWNHWLCIKERLTKLKPSWSQVKLKPSWKQVEAKLMQVENKLNEAKLKPSWKHCASERGWPSCKKELQAEKYFPQSTIFFCIFLMYRILNNVNMNEKQHAKFIMSNGNHFDLWDSTTMTAMRLQ